MGQGSCWQDLHVDPELGSGCMISFYNTQEYTKEGRKPEREDQVSPVGRERRADGTRTYLDPGPQLQRRRLLVWGWHTEWC